MEELDYIILLSLLGLLLMSLFEKAFLEKTVL